LIPQLSAVELARWRADAGRGAPLVVDVREPWEWELCRIDGSVSVPLGEIGQRLGELPRDRPLVLVCHHGGRSQHAATLLAGAGFTEVHNLRGGVEAWALDVDSTMKRY
jgi:rhodanese-related sulfurtransferase